MCERACWTSLACSSIWSWCRAGPRPVVSDGAIRVGCRPGRSRSANDGLPLQFLDAVHQVQQQFPQHFEPGFEPALRFLAVAHASGEFREFTAAPSAAPLPERHDLLHELQRAMERLDRPRSAPLIDCVLVPSTSPSRIRVWHALYSSD